MNLPMENSSNIIVVALRMSLHLFYSIWQIQNYLTHTSRGDISEEYLVRYEEANVEAEIT